MKNIFKRSQFWITAVIIVFLLADCDNDPGNNPDPVIPDVIKVEVFTFSQLDTVFRGGEIGFFASVTGTQNKTVSWSIEETNIHNETKIHFDENNNTLLFVSEDETLETLTIRATSNADPDKSGTLKVTIPVPTIEKIEISLAEPWVVPWQGKVDTGKGDDVEFTVKVIGENFIREAVTWSIDNTGKHKDTVINIDDNGVAQLRVAQEETLTSFKMQAVSKWDTGKIGEVTVTIKEPTITGMVINDQDGKVVPDGSITKPSKQIKTSSSESFRAIVTGTGKVNQNVTWEIERLTYIISVEEIRQDKDGKWTDGWASIELEIDLADDTEVYTWVKTGELTELASVYEKKPIERIPGSKEIKIWVTNYDDEGDIVNEQITLVPITGTTGIDATGKFTVDGLETFGKFRLTAVSTADTTMKKEVVVQIDSSSQIGIDPPVDI